MEYSVIVYRYSHYNGNLSIIMDKCYNLNMFKDKLKELRREKHITQVELAKQIGYGKSIISAWENGVSEPSETAIRNTALFFEVTTDYLLGLENEDGSKIKTTIQ